MTKLRITPEARVIDHLFEDSEFFLQEAKKLQGQGQHVSRRFIRASIITAFAALEAYLNTMLFFLDEADDLELVERAFIQEKRVELTEWGYFDLAGHRFQSLEEKIRFLYWKAQGLRIPKGDAVWQSFIEAKKLRDEIVHSKPGKVSYAKLTTSAADSCLKATSDMAKTLGWHRTL